MRANIAEEFPMWLKTEPSTEPIDEMLTFISPADNGVVQYDDVTLSWESLGEGTYYKVEVSPLNNFSFTDYNEVITENSVTLNNLSLDKKYYWRVLAFNDVSFCVETSPTLTFETGDLVGLRELNSLGKLDVFPNPLLQNKPLQVTWSVPTDQSLSLDILDIYGRVVHSRHDRIMKGSLGIDLNLDLSTGVYLLRLQSETGEIQSVKLVVK